MGNFTFPGGEVVSALGGMASSALSAAMSYKYSKKLMKFQQRWQEKMSNSAHQREVKDLAKAGLNPILSGTGGDGASSGAASGATIGANFDNPVTAFMEYKQAKLNQEQTKEQTRNTQSDTALKEQEKNNAYYDGIFKQFQNDYADSMLGADLALKQNQSALTSAQTVEQLAKNPFVASKMKAEIGALKSNIYANITGANANMMSAQANLINANTNKDSSPWKTGVDVIKFLGNSSSAKKFYKDFGDFGKRYHFDE